jgi:ApaG protein
VPKPYASCMARESVNRGSEAVTHGVRVNVSPVFLPEQSDPGRPVYVFGYRIRIRNEGDRAVELVSRRWVIVDAHGRREEVEGPGVVGQQPRIEPGSEFDYASYCPLRTPWGTMEGTYQMRRDDGTPLAVTVARFFLVAPSEPE